MVSKARKARIYARSDHVHRRPINMVKVLLDEHSAERILRKLN